MDASSVIIYFMFIINCNEIHKLFFVFEGPDEVVGPEGMEKFCEDIGVEPENVCFISK